MIWVWDLEGHFTYVSPSVLQLRGYTIEEAMQQSIVEALTPDSARLALDSIQRFLDTGTYPSNYFEFEQPCKDGSTVWTEISFTILRDKDGKPKSILGASRDITERKKAESLSKKVAEEWSRVFNATTDFMFIIDKENRLVNVNKKICDFLNKKPQDLIGKHCYEVMHGTDRPWVNCPHKKALEIGEPVSSEVEDAHIGTPLLVSVSPVPNEKGELIQFVHIARFIRTQKD